jgi:AcrR family transcriptional regulator
MNEMMRGAGRQPVMAEDERRKMILAAAERVFYQSGYGAATMEEVARVSGMAKKTLYRFFPDKMSLFIALIDSHDNPRLSWDERELADLDASQLMRLLLGELARFVLSPRQINLSRLVISEATKNPELARRFYQDCVVRTRDFVTAQVARNPIVPVVSGIDPLAIADTFVGGTLGSLQLKALMLDMSAEAIEAELEERMSATLAVLGISSPS